MPPRKKHKMPLDPYPAPEVVDVVSELPPPRRGASGTSIFDIAIEAAIKPENIGNWVSVDPKGRSMGGFRSGVRQRLDQLGFDMDMAQRGSLFYLRYAGTGKDIKGTLEQLREETRAKYGK